MINKKEYLACVEQLDGVCEKYELKTLLEDNKSIKKEMEDFVIHILMMGGFSAGKSALLNAFMQREVLPENQGEETVIAMELWYDEKEYIEAVSEDGIDTYQIDEIGDISPEKYNHLRVHLDSDFLGKIPGVRLVDMPGLDSRVERHSKAIQQYIGYGNAYLLCVACEDGVLKPSRSDFIKEVKQYKNSLVLAITKCDKKPASQIPAIAESIRTSAEIAFQEKIATYTVSANLNYEEDIEGKALEMINAFDAQGLFEQAFSGRIAENVSLCMKALVNMKNAKDFDATQIDEQIKKREEAQKALDKKLKAEEGRLEAKMRQEVKPNILRDIEDQLVMNVSRLTSAILTSPDAFSRTLHGIIRPVFMSATAQYVEESFDEFINEIGVIQEFDESYAQDIAGQYKEFSIKWKGLMDKNKDRDDGMYKAIFGALAALTDIVAPIMEIVILFLPEIVDLFKGILLKNQEEQIRTKIEFEIIPEVVQRISDGLDPTLVTVKEEMLKEIRDRYEVECQSEIEAIKKLQLEKEKQQLEYDDFIGEINEDMEDITGILNTLS